MSHIEYDVWHEVNEKCWDFLFILGNNDVVGTNQKVEKITTIVTGKKEGDS